MTSQKRPANASGENREEQLKVILGYIKTACGESKYYSEIERYLSTIKCKAVDAENLDEYVVPKTFTQYEVLYGFGGDTKASIIFIYGDGDDIREILKYKLLRKDIMKYFGYIGKNIAVNYIQYDKKRRYIDLISCARLNKLMNQNHFVKVISYKAYENHQRLVSQLEYGRCRYYVYCDRPYWSAKQTIQDNCKDKRWCVVGFGKFDGICLEVGIFGILFIPVCSAAGFYLDLETYFTGQTIAVVDMFERNGERKEFDRVINCLFEI